MANDVLSFSEYGEFFAEICETRPKNNKPASSRGYVKTKDGLHFIPVGEEQGVNEERFMNSKQKDIRNGTKLLNLFTDKILSYEQLEAAAKIIGQERQKYPNKTEQDEAAEAKRWSW